MKQIIFIYLVFLTKSESKVSFRNWKKYIVWPTSDKQFEALIDFQGKDQIVRELLIYTIIISKLIHVL